MENNLSISSDLIRGHINTIILRALYDGDKYGLEIIQEIEKKTSGQYILKQPTLYSSLKRLESQGYITSYWGGGETNGGRRRYYALTESGRSITEQNQAEWEYSRTVIDKLISEKDYDFDSPPPATNVDFNILKQSTTRVYGKSAEDEREEERIRQEREELERELEEKKKILAAEQEKLEQIRLQQEKLMEEMTVTEQQTSVDTEAHPYIKSADAVTETQHVNNIAENQKNETELTHAPDVEAKKDINNSEDLIFPEEKESKEERDYKLILNKLLGHASKKQEENLNSLASDEASDENLNSVSNSDAKPEILSFERNTLKEFNDYTIETQSKNHQKELIEDYNLLPKRQQGKIDFSDIYEEAEQDGFKIRAYSGNSSKDFLKKNKKDNAEKSLLLKNKLLLNVGILLYCIILAEVLLTFGIFNSIIKWKFSTYVLIASVLLIVPCAGIVNYVINPQKRVIPKFNFKDNLIVSFVVFMNLILIIFGCALIFDVSILEPSEMLGKILFPIILAFNVPLSVIIYKALYKSRNFYSE